MNARLTRTLRYVCLLAGMAVAFNPASVHGAFVHETPYELLSNGDFNGDGRLDVIVLDRTTGNARVGLQTAGGALNWSSAVSTGVPQPESLAVGRFAQGNRDAIAVTSPQWNRVHVLDLSSNSPAPVILWPSHADPTMLAGLESPYGTVQSYASLAVGGPQYDSPSDPGRTLVDLFGFLGDSLSYFQDQITAENFLGSANSFQRHASDATSLAVLRRGSSNDTFLVYSYTNSPGPLLMRSNLPSGSEYIFGRFNGEPYARVLFYVPGQSNIIVQSLIDNGGSVEFGVATVNTFGSAVGRVFFVDEQTNGLAVVRFGDGVVSGLRPPTGSGVLNVTYGFGLGAAGNLVSGALSLGNGRMAFLSTASNSISSAQAQVFTKNDSGYTQTSSSTLPQATSTGNRANVWLFANEPFVNSQPVFVASLAGGDWITSLTGLPGAVNVVAEDDRGATLGLGVPASSNLGAAPANAAFGLPNQYHSAISIFSYSAPRQADPVLVTISPNPDQYANPVSISFTTSPGGEPVYYRLGSSGAFNSFAAPFTLGSNTTVEFYATTAGGAQRSSTRSATYTFGNQQLGPVPAFSTNGTPATNQPPGGTPTNFQFAAIGTVFYGRSSGTTGSIWAVNLDGTRDRFVTEGMRPRVSPDGRYMAFSREGNPSNYQGNLWVRDLVTGQERRLFAHSDFIIGYDWEPAQTNLVFDQSCNVWRTDVFGNAAVISAIPGDCVVKAPARNPVDGRFAFHHLSSLSFLRGIYVTPPDFSSRQRLALPAANYARWPSWSPDGTLLAYGSGPNTSMFAGKDLWVMEPDGSAQYQITAFTGADGFVNGALWMPAGDALIGAGLVGGVNGIWIVELTPDRHACGSPPVLLPTTPGDPVNFVGTVFIPPPPPRLFIRRELDELVIFWRRSSVPYVLESTSDLNNGWNMIGGPFVIAGDFLEHRLPAGFFTGTEFFRLRRP